MHRKPPAVASGLAAALLAAALLASACGRQEAGVFNRQLFAFGTLIDISIYTSDEDAAARVVQQIDTLYQRQHRDWHAWQKGQLSDLNAAIAAGRPFSVDPSIITLIRMGQDFERSSGGLFNPAIGRLVDTWGFHGEDFDRLQPPAEGEIRRLIAAAPSSLDLRIDGNRVESDNRAVRLDLGGFAKGFSVGKAVQLLNQSGLVNFVVNAGGDLCASGSRGDRPWRIGIRHPRSDEVLASLQISDLSCVFTSGDYERFFEYEGQRFHHILDPRDGYPARHTGSVTVVTNEPTLADAAATALFVAGPGHWRAIAQAMGIEDVLLVDTLGNIEATASMQRRL